MAVSWQDIHASGRQAVADAVREGFSGRAIAREVRLRGQGEAGNVSASIDRVAWLLTGRLPFVASEAHFADVTAALENAERTGDMDHVLQLAQGAEEADQEAARRLASPARARHFYDRALRFWEQGDLLSAVADVTSALDATPDDVQMLSNRGGWLYNLGSPWAAVGDWEHAVKLQPEYANGWMKIATVLGEYGQRAKAIKCLERALEVAVERWPNRERVEAQLKEWREGG